MKPVIAAICLILGTVTAAYAQNPLENVIRDCTALQKITAAGVDPAREVYLAELMKNDGCRAAKTQLDHLEWMMDHGGHGRKLTMIEAANLIQDLDRVMARVLRDDPAEPVQ